MVRKIGLVFLLVALVVMAALPALAQGANAWTSFPLNMRSGPSTDYEVITALPSGTGLILEARSDNSSWVLGHTEDGSARGWLASQFLTFADGFNSFNLPVSAEVVTPGAAVPAQPAAAPEQQAPAEQTSGAAVVTKTINVRQGPGTNHRVITKINGNTEIVLEARNTNATWVLAHSVDGSIRGWMSAQFIRFGGAVAMELPMSGEILGGAPNNSVGDPRPEGLSININYEGVDMHGYDPARIRNIDLTAFPAVAQATGRARSIFRTGQAMGRDPHAIAKVGDCSTEHWYFLQPFSRGEYNLGQYANLQGAVDHFAPSLGVDSMASHNGFNVNAVLAPEWADPSICQPGESPLQCEFRLRNPSIAVIMFGTSDLLVMSPYEYDFYMRNIVDESIAAGVIPVLSTFPGNQGFWNRTLIYNQIVIKIALDYDIPLINLWLALESLPNSGLEPDGFHLGEPPSGSSACVLTPDNLQTGYPTRNLVTMQSLDAIWRGAMQ